MNNQLISVIVANYNNAQWLPQCLESIIKQTVTDLEIIVVDDCSTDASREIISALENKYPGKINPVFLQSNVGVAQARHEGILRSQGKFLTSLDADDFYFSNDKLEEELKLINYYKARFNKEVIAFSNVVRVDSEGKKMPAQSKAVFQGNLFEVILTRSGFIPRDMLIYRSMYFEAGGYDPTFKTYEDWDLKIRLAEKYEYYFTTVNGIAYRRHSIGLSSIHFDLGIQNLKAVFEKNIQLVENNITVHELRKGFELFMQKNFPGFKL